MRRLVVNSGGIDSAVTLAEAVADFPADGVTSLFVDLGSRQNRRELGNAKAQVELQLRSHLALSVAKIYCPWLANHPMFDDYTFLMSHESEQASAKLPVADRAFVVPMRNLMILSVAASLAATSGIGEIWLGFDYRGVDRAASSPSWDKRPEFVAAFGSLLKECNEWQGVKFVTPLQGNEKADTIRRGKELGINFKYTWSCYNDLPKHCGVCSACLQRKKGFTESGVDDPTDYASEGMLRTYADLGD